VEHLVGLDKRAWTSRDVATLLVGNTALSELSMADALEVVSLMKARRVKEGSVITQEGTENSDYMVLILSGEAVVQSEAGAHDETVVLDVASTGALPGELGLLDGEPRSATCIASCYMDVAILERGKLTHLMAEKPRVAANLLAAILKKVAQRLRISNKKVRTLSQINRSLQDELHVTKNPLAEVG
jgi:CRP/FNR family transcriptional regulator, cyclic AMP receptor protein